MVTYSVYLLRCESALHLCMPTTELDILSRELKAGQNPFNLQLSLFCALPVCATNSRQTGLEKKLFCGVLFCDMSNAFDRVQHVKLLAQVAGVELVALYWRGSVITCHKEHSRLPLETLRVMSHHAQGGTSRVCPRSSLILHLCPPCPTGPPLNCSALLYADDMPLSAL